MLGFTYHAKKHDNITRFCHREIVCHRNILTGDFDDREDTFHDIIPCSKFETVQKQISTTKKYKQSKQKHIKLSDIMN